MQGRFNRRAGNEAREESFVFVGDIDNLSHTAANIRGFLDIPRLIDLLRERGITDGVAVANRFSPIEARLWEGAGFACVATGCNADERIAEIIANKVAAGTRRIMVGSGDGRAFAMLVRRLVVDGVRVHVLANRSSLSRALAEVATGYAYADRYVHTRTAEAA